MKVQVATKPTKQESNEPEEHLPPPVLIEDWLMINVCGCGRGTPHLFGNVVNHPTLGNCRGVHTTKIVWMNQHMAQTQNTLYRLGWKL